MPRPARAFVTAFRIRAARAYSLIELMVVVALIALLAGGLGLALGDTGGSSLATAQTTLATLVGSARAHAAVQQKETLVAIYGTRPPAGDPEKFLRLLQVFRNDAPEGARERWVPIGNGVHLPRGVYLVPPTVNGLLAAGVVWPANPPLTSTVATLNLAQPNGTPFAASTTTYVIRFSPDGTVRAGAQPLTQGHARLVVATGGRAPNNLPQFNKREATRGVLIRPTGAISFANTFNGF